MTSTIIISDFLDEYADEVNVTEKGLVISWSELTEREITEDVIIIDTKLSVEEDKTGNKTVTGEKTWEAMKFLQSSLLELLDSGRTVIGLTSEINEYHPRPNKTYSFTNYAWLSLIDGFPSENYPLPGDELSAINNLTDEWWTEVKLRWRTEPYITYFLNVSHSEVYIEPENSNISVWDPIADIEGEDQLVGAMYIESWGDDDSIIDPKGKIMLLPRPTNLKIDVRDWFKALVQIGHEFSPYDKSLDQYNRVLGRTHSPLLNPIYRICDRFSLVARQLEERHSDRETIEVQDEYDVQDLYHGLLRLFYDDVRKEEWAPSYGGSSPRIDFLVKSEKISVEIKITRNGRSNDEILNELSEDKEHYRTHPDCEYLICFVYDPEYKMDNPAGFERDLSEEQEDLITEVIVSSTERFGDI